MNQETFNVISIGFYGIITILLIMIFVAMNKALSKLDVLEKLKNQTNTPVTMVNPNVSQPGEISETELAVIASVIAVINPNANIVAVKVNPMG